MKRFEECVMMKRKKNIEWSNLSFNWFSGCLGPDKDGVHCPGCYAKNIAETRLRGRAGYPEDEPFRPTVHYDKLRLEGGWSQHPSRRKKPTIYFNVAMGDWLLAPGEALKEAGRIMQDNPQHIFITLTKLYGDLWKIPSIFDDGYIPENVWVGVSICTRDHLWGLPKLLDVDCAVRFLSMEPMMQDLSFIELDDIDWLIIGARTRQGSTPAFMPKISWVMRLVEKARKQKISVFLKPNLRIPCLTSNPIEEMPFHLMSEESVWHEEVVT